MTDMTDLRTLFWLVVVLALFGIAHERITQHAAPALPQIGERR